MVEPVTSSVNSGDCFVVVTPGDVIQWMGQFANVIERAKCADVAQRILIKKDFGCLKAEQVLQPHPSPKRPSGIVSKILVLVLDRERECLKQD